MSDDLWAGNTKLESNLIGRYSDRKAVSQKSQDRKAFCMGDAKSDILMPEIGIIWSVADQHAVEVEIISKHEYDTSADPKYEI